MISAEGGPEGRPQNYTYNADGQRVRREVEGTETWQAYGMDGELLAEYPANGAVLSPQKEYGYRNGQLLVTAEAPFVINVASSANGGTASSSSNYNDGTYIYTAAGANNGVRSGASLGQGEGWEDAAPPNSFPDWLQIEFNGSKVISEIDVFTVQNIWYNPSEPTEAMTFSAYGLTGYDVQYWNPDTSGWVTVTDGSVTGNDKVWRKFTFASVTTTKIRVLSNASPDGHSRLTEVEAWGYASGSANINWLVTDQLGTPRMTLDKTGSLAAVKRHDYLPFGEELFNGTGGRTTGLGYTADTIRQKFTSYERDDETGLDYAQARYYASAQGRFTSSDPLMASAVTVNPKTWNRYAYALNNPLRYTDPTGLSACRDASCSGSDEDDNLLRSVWVEDKEAKRDAETQPSTQNAHALQLPTDADDLAMLAVLLGEASTPGEDGWENEPVGIRARDNPTRVLTAEEVQDEMRFMVSVVNNRLKDQGKWKQYGYKSWKDVIEHDPKQFEGYAKGQKIVQNLGNQPAEMARAQLAVGAIRDFHQTPFKAGGDTNTFFYWKGIKQKGPITGKPIIVRRDGAYRLSNTDFMNKERKR